MTTTLTDKIDYLRTIYDVVRPNNEDRIEFKSQNFHDWYEYWGEVCLLADLTTTGWFGLTESGAESIEQAYLSFQNLIRLPKGKQPFPNEEWRRQKFDWQEDFPFNKFNKPKAVVYV